MYGSTRSPITRQHPPYLHELYRSSVLENAQIQKARWVTPVKLVFASGLFSAFLLLIAALLFIFFYSQWSRVVIPGVQVGNIPIGGSSITESAVAVHKAWNVGRKIIISDGQHTWLVPASDLGLSVDAVKTVQLAYRFGHQQDLGSDILQMIACQRDGCRVEPIFAIDVSSARLGLEKIANQVYIPTQEATLHFEGSTLVSTSGQSGYSLDIEKTLVSLAQNYIQIMQSGRFQLILTPVAPRVSDASAAKTAVERILNNPPLIHAYDPISNETLDWSPSKETMASWIRIEPGDQGLQVMLDKSRLQAYLDEKSSSLDGGRHVAIGDLDLDSWEPGNTFTLIVKHDPTLYTTESGDTLLQIGWKIGMPFWMIARANPDVDTNRLKAGLHIVIPSKDDLLPLPVVLNKRIVINISQQRMWTYQDGAELAKYVISTGIDRSPTQPGVFQVRTHVLSAYAKLWDLTMPNFLGIYEAWPGFMNGIHGLPTLSGGRLLWSEVLGRPASYGCIILGLDEAAELYDWAEDGVVVEIQP